MLPSKEFIAILVLMHFGFTTETKINKIYKFRLDVKGNWHYALKSCRQMDMQLATIRTQADQDVLAKLINENKLQNEHVWLSGSALSNDSRGFVWASSGLAFRYTNWKTGEPDNKNQAEQCVTYNKGWNDVPCTDELHFVCENVPCSECE